MIVYVDASIMFANEFRFRDGHLELPGNSGGRRNQTFDAELVAVNHQPNQRLLIIRVAADVGQHE